MANAGFNFELSYGSYNPFIVAALFGVPTVINLAGITATLDASASTITGAAGDFDDVPVGSSPKLSGFTVAGNNGIKLVTAKSVDGSILTFAAGTFVADQAGATIGLTGSSVRNGNTRKSYTMERRIITTDELDHFQSFVGMVVDTLALNFESKQIITGSFGFMGARGFYGDDSLSTSVTGVHAEQTLTTTGNVLDTETVTIGDTVYTFAAAPAEAYELEIGADAEESIDNLVAAINGELFGTPAHPDVTAVKASASTMTVTAKAAGTGAHAIVTEETSDTASWGAGVLAGGTDSGEYAASPTTDVLNATTNVGTFIESGEVATECFRAITLNIGNGLRGKDCMGIFGAFDIGTGTFQVSGNLSGHFMSNRLYGKFVDHLAVLLSWQVTDDAGNTIVFTIPKFKFRTALPNAQGLNQDLLLNAEYTGLYDPVTDAMMIIDFHAAA